MVLDGMAKRVLPLGNLRTCHADGSRHGPLTLFVYCHLRILEDACKFLALGATCVNIRDGLFVPQGEDRIDACCTPRRDVTRDQGHNQQQEKRGSEGDRVICADTKSMLESTRDTAAHPATPASPPSSTGRIACRSTRLMTSLPSAPSAMRMPISRTHRLTRYDAIA